MIIFMVIIEGPRAVRALGKSLWLDRPAISWSILEGLAWVLPDQLGWTSRLKTPTLNFHLIPPESLQLLQLPLHLSFPWSWHRQVGPLSHHSRHVVDHRQARVRLRQAARQGPLIYLRLWKLLLHCQVPPAIIVLAADFDHWRLLVQHYRCLNIALDLLRFRCRFRYFQALVAD